MKNKDIGILIIFFISFLAFAMLMQKNGCKREYNKPQVELQPGDRDWVGWYYNPIFK